MTALTHQDNWRGYGLSFFVSPDAVGTGIEMAHLRPYLSKRHREPRVDDRRVLSGIAFVDRTVRFGDRGDDAEWFNAAVKTKGIQPYIPGRTSRLERIAYANPTRLMARRIELGQYSPTSDNCVA